ncbi:ASST-domain-containing protein [Aspergillus karnatakaensis]|uniref:arylsulfotransferase family protein n=1 Tax=Aspergillus karnatakaensis TaxID=1810916 RepID=UPI003CCD4485
MRLSKAALIVTALRTTLATSTFNPTYLSRPDLTPPKLNITISSDPSAVSQDYIFISPYHGFEPTSSGPAQPAAYILRADGDLVWSGAGYFAGYVANFGPAVIDGKPVLRAAQGLLIEGHGRSVGNHAILNDRYETEKVLRAAGHKLVSVHEFEVVDDGKHVLIEVPVPVQKDLTEFGGEEGQGWVLDSGFQELDVETGELIFEWYSLEHLTPKYSALPLEPTGPFNARFPDDAWDYFHLNSAAKDRDGNYLISARNYAAIFKVNGTTGEVIWQLGGVHGSDFDVPVNVQFGYQHDARIRYVSDDGTIERISFFDNAYHPRPAPGPISSSRARYIELNHTAGTVTEVKTYWPPDGLFAGSQGNTQFLANGNVFVNWGQAGAITEFSEDGDVLFHAYLDSSPSHDVQSYRGFKYPWTGFSSEEIAVLVLGNVNGAVEVYVSWNGDTETKYWAFYLVDTEAGGKRYIGKQKRDGFETVFRTDLDLAADSLSKISLVAEAHGKDRVLGKSGLTGLTDVSHLPIVDQHMLLAEGQERLEL